MSDQRLSQVLRFSATLPRARRLRACQRLLSLYESALSPCPSCKSEILHLAVPPAFLREKMKTLFRCFSGGECRYLIAHSCARWIARSHISPTAGLLSLCQSTPR